MPRLLYLGDVPVESSYHGSALLFRLLQNYPSDRLVIVESNLSVSLAARRIPGVRYASVSVGSRRLLNTRFAKLYSSWLTLSVSRRSRHVGRVLEGFDPETVLTVTHGYLWQAAAQFASDHRLPLCLICHDDWPRVSRLSPRFSKRLDQQFERVYRQAVSRLLISPYMQENYVSRYGVPGTVLYPSRAADCLVFDAPAESLRSSGRPLNFVFAGTINTAGYVRALQMLADGLAPAGNKLLIFGPYKPTDASSMQLDRPNVEFRGLVAAQELIPTLRAVTDVLFIPMSFALADRENMQCAFPSKLTDCTAVGVPLLIYGPEYSSAVRWAEEHPGVAEVVTSEDGTHLAKALERLVDPRHRLALAREALAVGNRMFAHSAVCEIFYDSLLKASPSCHP